MKIALASILVLLLVPLDNRAQLGNSSNPLHERYWFYKTRLNNDFLKVGLGNGESIPMAERNIYPDANGCSSLCKYGDELTLIGPYIGVLATEHYLLSSNLQSTANVDHELFCALNALDRLDYYAEPTFGAGFQPSLNGFLLKDDIPKDFLVNNYSHFNLGPSRYQSFSVWYQ